MPCRKVMPRNAPPHGLRRVFTYLEGCSRPLTPARLQSSAALAALKPLQKYTCVISAMNEFAESLQDDFRPP